MPKVQVAISTQDLKNDFEVNDLLEKMNLKTDYIIINQTLQKNIAIKNDKVITKYEKGLSKSRNTAIQEVTGDIVLFADDDVVYQDNYENVLQEAWKKYKDADIICFYVKSRNPKRKTKRMWTGRVGYIKSMRIVSFEISFKKKSIQENHLMFNENFGAGAKINRGEEQIFLCDAIRKGMKVIFVNKKIGEAKQEKSSWFTGYNLDFLKAQSEVFKKMSPKYYKLFAFQYAIRKYFLYRENISIKDAISAMLGKDL